MSKELYAIKLEMELTPKEESSLDGQSRICNWLYNHLLEKVHSLKEEFKKTKDGSIGKAVYSQRGLRNLIPGIKKENPFLCVVHSSPLKNAALRLSESIRNYQNSVKGIRKGPKLGFPIFKSWKADWFSLFYDEPKKGFSLKGDLLTLSLGVGQDKKRRCLTAKLKDVNALEGKEIRNLRIVSELGKYYAIFTTRKELPKQKKVAKVIAFDPNHKNFAYGVDSEQKAIEIKAPTWLKKYDRRIDELKSKRDRCTKKSKKMPVLTEQGDPTGKEYYLSSRRWKKYNNALKKTYRKRREQTKTFMYQLSNQLFKKYDCVGVGDYTPQGQGKTSAMRRSMNNRSLIGRWKKVLRWVAKKSGKIFLEFDEKGTTRTCNECLYIHKEGIALEKRMWRCPECEKIHIRDENSAINGIRRVISELVESNEGVDPSLVPCSGLFCIDKRWAWSVLPGLVVKTIRRQDSNENLQLQEIKFESVVALNQNLAV